MKTKTTKPIKLSSEDIAIRDAAFQVMENLIEAAKEVKVSIMADEILNWVIANVEAFIDNHRKMFKLDLMLDESVQALMPETMKLQNLYQAIPADEIFIPQELLNAPTNILLKNPQIKAAFAKLKDCKEALDGVSKKVMEEMRQKPEALAALFKRMVFYYEMIGVRDGEPLLKELEGAVAIVDFEYENFSVNVNINSPEAMIQDGATGISQKTNIAPDKKYVIPAAFTLWLEIAFHEQNSMTSIF